jgi:hypothetical protein
MENLLIITIFISFVIIIILIVIGNPFVEPALFRTRYRKREKDMKNLASDYNLNFSSNLPNYSNFMRVTWLPFNLDTKPNRTNWITNRIEGQIGKHKIVIYDELFRSQVYILFRNLTMQQTFVFVDDKCITKKKGAISFLTRVKELRKFLDGLKRDQ